MLTFEETRWFFRAIKFYSALNLLPVKIDMKTGKIERWSSKLRGFLWRMIFSLAVFQCLFMMWRLAQSTLIEPTRLFRWDHFVLHIPFAFGYSFIYFIGYCVFVKDLESLIIIFNQIFVEKENPVQKMMEEEKQEREEKLKNRKERGNRGVKIAKSGAWVELKPKSESSSVSVLAPHQEEEQKGPVLNLDVQKGPRGACFTVLGKKEAKSETGSISVSAPHQKQMSAVSNLDAQKNLKTERAGRPLLTWPPQYSLDELLARTFPVIAPISGFFTLVILALDQNRPQYFYSVLPPEYQNLYSFLGCLAVEAVFVTVVIGFGTFSIVSQLLFFAKCQVEFKRLDLQLVNLEEKFQSRPTENRDIRREIWILRQISKEMKELVLFIELFNRCFPPCIFALKLCCFLPILFYFFTTRRFQDFPFLAVFTGYIAVAMTLIYGILYQHAFSIPEKMERLKREFLLSAHKTASSCTLAYANVRFRAEMWREIGAIRDVGVKVGSFHTLERETTPKFVDFVVKNLVNLLVTFPP